MWHVAYIGIVFVMQVAHDTIAAQYNISRSNVATLQDNAGKFAGMVAAFCECLGYSDLETLISKFQVSNNTDSESAC